MTNISTDRKTAAPNGSTYEQFEAFIAALQAEGRGAKDTFALINPSGNDLAGVSMDLLCLSDKGDEFHGFYSTATYDSEGGVMSADFVLEDFWANCVQAAWDEQDNLDAREE